MTNNPVLDELYAAREKLLQDAGGNVKEYLKGVRTRERASGRLLTPAELEKLKSVTVGSKDDSSFDQSSPVSQDQ